jgi:hypothetical protein
MNEVPNQSLSTRTCRFKQRPALPICHVKTNDRTEHDRKLTYTIPFLKKHNTMEASSVSTSGKEAPNLAGPIYQAIL